MWRQARSSANPALCRSTTPLSLPSYANALIGERRGNWQTADRSSAGLLPNAAEHPDALIRVFAARTVRWRGIFAVHTWIVVKERGASRYSRYDYTAWGEPIRVDGFAPDGRWFGAVPETVVSVDGEEAEKLIPKIRSVVENYRFRAYDRIEVTVVGWTREGAALVLGHLVLWGAFTDNTTWLELDELL